MSSIEKLSIRGIRSFSPNREEVIEFYHPLTVILGDNGSGKTTVIECLKVACTGSLPPGARSGQSFVHDPRIAGTNEVKASVKLRFRNRAGKPMVVQRTFQLQQSKNGPKFKALDGAVRVKNDLGENVSMSHKCAELDRHIPEMLGVSKAILESVIFCHQEESNWPLQEGAVLKKRFDDIFESARYTKALEAIRKLKKARGDNAKDFKRDLSILNVQLKGAEEIQRKIEAAEAKLHAAADEAKQLDENVEVAEETLEEMELLEKEIKEEHSELERMQAVAAQNEQVANSAYHKIEKVMSDSDAELVRLVEEYESIMAGQQHAYKSLEDQASQLKREEADAQDTYTKLSTEKGKLETRIEAQQALVTEILDLASSAGTKYQFYAQPISSQDDDVKSFLRKFEHYVSQKTKALAEAEAHIREGDDSLNVLVSDLNAKLHHIKEQLKVKQAEREALNVDKRKNAAKMKQLSVDPAPSAHRITEAEKVLNEAESALERFKTQQSSLSIKKSIDDIAEQINAISFDMSRDDKMIDVLRGSERDYMALDTKRLSIREKEAEFQDKLADKTTEFKTILGDKIPTNEATLSGTVESLEEVLAKKKKAYKDLKNQAQEAEKKLQENLASSKHVEKTVESLRVEKNELERGPVGELRKHLEEISPGEGLHSAESIVQKAEKAYFAAKDKTMRCKNTITFLNIFKEKGIKDKCCPLCVREMSSTDEELFIKTINEKTDDKKVKDKIKKAEAAEEAAFRKWKGAEANMPSWRKWKRMEDQVVEKSKELEFLYAAQRSLQSDVNEKTNQADQAHQDTEEAAEAARAFTLLQGLASDLKHLRTKTEAEAERLRTRDAELLGANAPNLATVQAARNEKQDQVQELNRQLKLKQAELQRVQDTQQQLQNDLHMKREAKAHLDELRRGHEAAVEEQVKLREREQSLADEISRLKSTERQYEHDQPAKVHELQKYRSETAARLLKIRQEEQQCTQEFRSFQEKWRTVQAQADQELDVKLKRLGEEIAQIKQRQIAAAQTLEDLSPQIANARDNLAGQENLKRHIQDNLDYRELVKHRDDFRVRVEDAQRKASSLPALDEVSRRVRAARSKVSSAKEERGTLRGRQQQLELQLREEKVKLRSADFRNIEEKHRQKLIQYETTMMAVSDLDKYYKALDKSLLQFHSKKVEEINTIIKSLWQITYKGQDIDTIEVISGQEVDTGGTKASRSYDYRVVMKKGGALIDMRGRCSAGQKVLAALVIRLALAETFCLNCGILALDEPTTNLDTENKLGLAQAITDILNARSAQQNFQLVCITHDEEFVQMLSEAQAMDGTRPEFYWRVSREDIGNNRFCSKIEKREWRDGI